MISEAEYYQNHKDDPDEWGDPVPPPIKPINREDLIAALDNLGVKLQPWQISMVLHMHNTTVHASMADWAEEDRHGY